MGLKAICCKIKHKILAPLYVLSEEPLYLVWVLFVGFFGLINIWGGLLLGQIDSVSAAFLEGIMYTYSISICAPFLAEVFVKQVVKKRTEEKPDFLSYQMVCSAINIIWIAVLTFLWLGKYKGSTPLQIWVGVISTIFSFYMYCVGQMEQHKAKLAEYDDSPYAYLHDEKERMVKTAENSRNITSIAGDEGDIDI